MWRIWHKLFGWDYILWCNTADSGIARLRKDYTGKVWWYRYKITKRVDTLEENSNYVKLWLTCDSSKYNKET